MGVNHYMLPLSGAELEALLRAPETGRELAEHRGSDVRFLGGNGVAIVSLTAESDADPLAFIQSGGPDGLSGWVGEYVVEDGRVVECQADMGYGPGSYYRNPFVRQIAEKLRPWTVEVFAGRCDLDWLEDYNVYPSGWHDQGRREELIDAFAVYRRCVLAAADAGQHLLVWCA